jgi:hypothetical protein
MEGRAPTIYFKKNIVCHHNLNILCVFWNGTRLVFLPDHYFGARCSIAPANPSSMTCSFWLICPLLESELENELEQ